MRVAVICGTGHASLRTLSGPHDALKRGSVLLAGAAQALIQVVGIQLVLEVGSGYRAAVLRDPAVPTARRGATAVAWWSIPKTRCAYSTRASPVSVVTNTVPGVTCSICRRLSSLMSSGTILLDCEGVGRGRQRDLSVMKPPPGSTTGDRR